MSLSFLTGDEEKLPDVIIIDLSQIALATVMATYDNGEELTVKKIRKLVLATLKYNALKFRKDGYTEVVVCVDNGKNGYWRKWLSPYYKGNRAKAREESGMDWDGYYNGINIVIEEFKANMPYYIIDVQHAEADDGFGVLAKKFSNEGRRVMLVSSDGDFTQLQKYPNVRQWSPIQKKFVLPKTDPYMDKLIKIVKGDKKDNVASIKVRGDFHTTKCPGERSPNVYKQELEALSLLLTDEEIQKVLPEDQWARFKENRVLIDFDYIDENIQKEILACYTEYKLPARRKIYSYFVKSGLSELLNDIDKF